MAGMPRGNHEAQASNRRPRSAATELLARQERQDTVNQAYNLMPEELAARVPALYSQENNEDPTIQAKYFVGSWTWYLLEYSPVAPDGYPRLCFGLVDGFDKELGYFSLDELEELRGPFGLKVERDLYFKPCPLSEVNK